jgi:selenocysteine-specific elongation factor
LSPPRGRARPARIAFLKVMESGDSGQALAGLLEQEREGVNLDHFEAARNLTPEDAEGYVARCEAVVVRVRGARVGISTGRWNGLRERVLDALRQWHDAHPDAVGPDDQRVRQTLGEQTSRALAGAALQSLVREGIVVREGASLRLASHSPVLSPQESALWERVRHHLSEHILKPPVVTDLAQRLHLEVGALDAFLGRSVGRGQLVRLARNRFFHPRAIAELAHVAEGLAEECGGGLFDAKSYRDRSGLGRNLAVEVLEYFDAAGLTMRVGDTRKVIGSAKRLFGEPPL